MKKEIRLVLTFASVAFILNAVTLRVEGSCRHLAADLQDIQHFFPNSRFVTITHFGGGLIAAIGDPANPNTQTLAGSVGTFAVAYKDALKAAISQNIPLLYEGIISPQVAMLQAKEEGWYDDWVAKTDFKKVIEQQLIPQIRAPKIWGHPLFTDDDEFGLFFARILASIPQPLHQEFTDLFPVFSPNRSDEYFDSYLQWHNYYLDQSSLKWEKERLFANVNDISVGKIYYAETYCAYFDPVSQRLTIPNKVSLKPYYHGYCGAEYTMRVVKLSDGALYHFGLPTWQTLAGGGMDEWSVRVGHCSGKKEDYRALGN